MSTSTLSVSVTYIPGAGLQPVYGPPVQLTAFADSSPTQYVATEIQLPAAGTSVTLPVPTSWTTVNQVILQNLDSVGYCTVTLTNIGPSVQLAPNGGLLSLSAGTSVAATQSNINPRIWTLNSCNSSGVLASGVVTRVYVYLAGS